jgi:glycosyltransferase involved in cell wall biosynthesis
VIGPEVSVVVPSKGAARTLPALLRALRAQTLPPDAYEVLIVDPGADGGARVLEQAATDWDGPALRLLRGPLSGGPATKRNAGAAAARGSVLAFTDADCAPDPAWLEAGLGALRAGADLAQGSTLPPDGEAPMPFTHHIVVRRDVGLHEGCNIFYRRDLFRSLGGFSTRYFRRYRLPFGEDVELGWRARRAGARFRFEPNAVVRHPVGPASMRAHLREQWLARGFPALVRDAPELRDSLFYRRVFLSRRSAAFVAALFGAGVSWQAPLAAALGLPYARLLWSDLHDADWSARARAATAYLGSDATRAAALAWGSLRARRLVL